jgi:hypothetical protein
MVCKYPRRACEAVRRDRERRSQATPQSKGHRQSENVCFALQYRNQHRASRETERSITTACRHDNRSVTWQAARSRPNASRLPPTMSWTSPLLTNYQRFHWLRTVHQPQDVSPTAVSLRRFSVAGLFEPGTTCNNTNKKPRRGDSKHLPSPLRS